MVPLNCLKNKTLESDVGKPKSSWHACCANIYLRRQLTQPQPFAASISWWNRRDKARSRFAFNLPKRLSTRKPKCL